MTKRIDFPEFRDLEEYPVEASASGKNAYFHHCEHIEHFPAYASCLSHIEDRKNGRLSAAYTVCSVAISKGSCGALAMRKQEIEAGKAMFFVNRKKLNEYNIERDQQAPAPLSQSSPARSIIGKAVAAVKAFVAPSAPPKPAFSVGTNDYAAAINTAISNSQSPLTAHSIPKPAKIDTTIQGSTKGLSMIEIARLQLAQNRSPK